MAEPGEARILPFPQPASATTMANEPGEASVLPGESGGEVVSEADKREHLRMMEAILFASSEPVPEKLLAQRLPDGVAVQGLLQELQAAYSARGVNLVRIGGNWAFRTADDLGFLLQKEAIEPRKLTRAALEVLAIIGYHQPVTRAEIEEIRGVATSKGTLDVLMEAGWVRMRGRRRTPGRPATYGTTDSFLDHFGLEEISRSSLAWMNCAAGLLQSQLPSNFRIPTPAGSDEMFEDEDPLTPQDLEELGLLTPGGGEGDEE
ncbi:MAG: SMC-Scp complex subunit ScpB [Nitratireductor sp.]